MKLKTLFAATCLAALSGAAFAQDQVTLKFWDNQQTESGLSQYQQEAVKRFEAENPDIKVEVTTIPYPGIPAAPADRGAGRQRAGCLHPRPDLGGRLRRGRRDRAARRPGQGRRHQARHLLQGRLGFGQLRRQALGHPLQRRRLVVLLRQQCAAQGRRHRSGQHGFLRRAEGGCRKADRHWQGALRRRPVRAQGRGHRRRAGQLHLLERRQGARRRAANAR